MGHALNKVLRAQKKRGGGLVIVVSRKVKRIIVDEE